MPIFSVNRNKEDENNFQKHWLGSRELLFRCLDDFKTQIKSYDRIYKIYLYKAKRNRFKMLKSYCSNL